MRPVTLEYFDDGQAGGPDGEEARLAAYDQGYAAGWDDAIAAQSDEISRLRADLGRNLCTMGLTWREAHRHILTAIEPLIAEMTGKVLPNVARAALGAVILDELRPLAAQLSAAPFSIRTAPENVALVERLIADADFPLTVTADDTFGPGQALLRIGRSGGAEEEAPAAPQERLVDLDRAVAAIAQAVEGYFQHETDGEDP